MPTRRLLLSTASRALLLLAGASATAQPLPAGADPLAPWRAAPAASHPDWRVRAAGWAVLAPNPHNRQPWVLQFRGADEVLLRCDLDRRLPVTDPEDRQITIGLGAFTALFRMAAAAEGIALDITPFPEGAPSGRLDSRPVALLRRAPGRAEPDPLFAHALARRSAKRPFAMDRPLPEGALATLAALSPAIHATADADRVAPLRELMWRAWMVELETPAAHLESVNLMRLGRAEVAARPDGISIWGPGLEEMVASGALTRAGFALPGSPAHVTMVERYRPMLAATPALVWTTSAGNTKPEALAAGADWLRLNLAATGLGLALHPVSQALQEYPEMAGPFADIHRLLGVAAPGRVQMLGRLGILPGPAAAPTPRWPAESRIMGA